jgi:hypothetical protein
MSYLHHLEACNRFDPERFLPLRLAGRRVGFVRRDNARALRDHPGVFEIDDRQVAFVSGLAGLSVTQALGAVVEDLVGRGVLAGTRNEAFAVAEYWGGPVLFQLDRGAVPFFGTRSYGVHLNGFRRAGERVEMWIGKRAADKRIAPDKLDNLVAGGISAGYGARDTLVKEAAEEAAMPEALALTATPVGALLYRMELPEGMRDDVLFSYDIALPPSFEPRNTDGEIASFRILALEECLRLVAETDAFKFNVNLVLIDFAMRHGVITPEHPDYMALVTGLRGALIREIK